MRIPLAKYGLRELFAFGGLALAATVAAAVWWWYAAPVLAALFIFIVAFFRDPERRVPQEPGLVVAPADGTVVDVAETDEPRVGGRAVRIGIFMSLVSVHVNRSPCSGRVESVDHRPGRFLNAMDPAASAENESAAIVLADADGRGGRLLVRQVAGLIARRIVTAAAPGDRLERGQRIGMIKFGSRAEVYVPAGNGFEVLVAPGQHVKAGETVLGRFR